LWKPTGTRIGTLRDARTSSRVEGDPKFAKYPRVYRVDIAMPLKIRSLDVGTQDWRFHDGPKKEWEGGILLIPSPAASPILIDEKPAEGTARVDPPLRESAEIDKSWE
jgi:hypothetical protein